MRIKVYLDTGEHVTIPGQDDPIGSYINGFRDKSPSLSFETGPDRWIVIPAHRVVAVEAVPDLPDAETIAEAKAEFERSFGPHKDQ